MQIRRVNAIYFCGAGRSFWLAYCFCRIEVCWRAYKVQSETMDTRIFSVRSTIDCKVSIVFMLTNSNKFIPCRYMLRHVRMCSVVDRSNAVSTQFGAVYVLEEKLYYFDDSQKDVVVRSNLGYIRSPERL